MKVCSNLPPQKLLVARSNLAPSVVIINFPGNSSIVNFVQVRLNSNIIANFTRGCGGDVSDFIMWKGREASSWAGEYMLNSEAAPHTQLFGILRGVYPYLKARASTKAPLCREEPCSSSGIAVSHFKELFTRARSTVLWRRGVSSYLKWLVSVITCLFLCWCTCVFLL